MAHDADFRRELGQQLRVDSVRSSAAAGSGHPTSSMSAADLVAVLIDGHLRLDYKNPDNPANDHLIYSKGHASPLYYAALKAVGAIDSDDGAILPERPERQPFECCCILGRGCVDHEEIGDHGLRLAGSHLDAQAKLQCDGIGGGDPSLRSAAGNDDQWLVSRQGFASVPSDPLRRELWEVDRYDPGHRGLQFQIRHIRRLSRASVLRASAPSRRRQQVVFPTARC